MNRVVEILAPAGSLECLQAAIAAGADAVYLGGTRFGARAYAQNLSEEDMVQAIEYVHIHRRKIYMTVNTLLKDRETGGIVCISASVLQSRTGWSDRTGYRCGKVYQRAFSKDAGTCKYTDDHYQYARSGSFKTDTESRESCRRENFRSGKSVI